MKRRVRYATEEDMEHHLEGYEQAAITNPLTQRQRQELIQRLLGELEETLASQARTIMKTASPSAKDSMTAWTRATRTAWRGRRGPNLFRCSASPCVEMEFEPDKGWSMVAAQDIGAREFIDEMTLEDVDFETNREFGRYSWGAYGPRKGPDSQIHCIHAVNEPSPGEAVNAIIRGECSNTHGGQDV